MRNSMLDRILLEKSLSAINHSDMSGLVDHMVLTDKSVTKNVCAKVAPELSDRIDNIVTILGLSKRKFLEAAYIEACERAEHIMREEGVYEMLKEESQEISA